MVLLLKMEIFLESFKWIVEKNAAPGGRLQCDPYQWRQIEDKSTQGGSISVCEYLFRDMFQTVDNNTYYEFIHMKGAVVFKLRWKKEIVKISWRLRIVKLNHMVEQIKYGVVIDIKASLRMVLVVWLAILMGTVWLLWGENPLRTKMLQKTQNNFYIQ
jgi:hypothetical protein